MRLTRGALAVILPMEHSMNSMKGRNVALELRAQYNRALRAAGVTGVAIRCNRALKAAGITGVAVKEGTVSGNLCALVLAHAAISAAGVTVSPLIPYSGGVQFYVSR